MYLLLFVSQAKKGETKPPKLKTEDPNKSYVQRPVKRGWSIASETRLKWVLMMDHNFVMDRFSNYFMWNLSSEWRQDIWPYHGRRSSFLKCLYSMYISKQVIGTYSTSHMLWVRPSVSFDLLYSWCNFLSSKWLKLEASRSKADR